MARIAEQSERYEDMIHYMTRVACMGTELSLEERNLLSVSFKNAVGARRAAWRQITSMMAKEAQEQPVPQCVHDYKAQVENELKDKCGEILRLLAQEPNLIATSTSDEAKVFYRKMEGDYYRYLAEFSQGEQQQAHATAAHGAYSQASTVAKTALHSTHPVRLGLALNFAVFYFEVYGRASEACSLAKEAFYAAMADMERQQVSPEQTQDAMQILSLLRDNLMLWQNDLQQGDGRPPEQDGTVCEDM